MALSLDGPTLPEGRWQLLWASTFAPKLPHPNVPRVVGFFRRTRSGQPETYQPSPPAVTDTFKSPIGIPKLPILPLGTVLDVSAEHVDRSTRVGPSTILRQPLSGDLSGEMVLCFDRDNLQVVSRLRGLQALPGYKESKLHLDRLPKELAEDAEYEGYFVHFKAENLVVPCYEIFRAFYSRDSKFVQWYFNDHFGQPDRFLYNPKRGGLNLATGHAMLWLRQWVDDRYARFVAHFAFSETAMSAAQSTRSHYLKPEKDGHSRLIALPHFNGNWRVSFLQVPDTTPNPPLIVVRQITGCDWFPAFRKLNWDRDNDARKPEKDPRGSGDKTPINRRPSRPPQIPPEDKNFEEVDGNASDKIGADRGAVEQRLFNENIVDVFGSLASIEAEKMPQEETNYKSGEVDSQRARQSAFDAKMSTLLRSFGTELGRPVVLEANQNPRESDVVVAGASGREPPTSLLDFAVMLAAGNDLPDYTVEFVDVWPGTAHAHGVRIFSLPSKLGQKQPAWLFQNAGKSKPRLAIAAKVTKRGDDGDQIRIVLDFEEQVRIVIEEKLRIEARRNSVFILAQCADVENIADALAEVIRSRALNDGHLEDVCAANHFRLGLRKHLAVDSKRNQPLGLMEWVFNTVCGESAEGEAAEDRASKADESSPLLELA